MDMPQSLKSNLARRQKEQVKESRERSAEQLCFDQEPVASAVEGSDLGPPEDPFEPTTSCTTDTKNMQLVTQIWSSETEMLCMQSPPQAGNEFACCCSKFFKTVFQQVYHFKVDVIARNGHRSSIQEHQDLDESSVAVMLREMQREVNTGHPW